MWGLMGHLLARGQIVQPNAQFEGEFIAIYPEIVNGNPFNAPHVVRYILNKPGVMSGNGIPGPTSFDSTDRLCYFSRLFGKARDDRYYFLPILNIHLFKDQGKRRTKTAYFVGKGVSTGIHPKDAILIDRPFAQDQQALADLLNECQVLYCYDPVTAMTEIARLCGTRIVMVNPIYNRDQFRDYEPGLNGISWGKDTEVPLDSKGFRSHYLNLKLQFGKNLDWFIEETQR